VQDQIAQSASTAAFEAMVVDALTARWDVCVDDDTTFND